MSSPENVVRKHNNNYNNNNNNQHITTTKDAAKNIYTISSMEAVFPVEFLFFSRVGGEEGQFFEGGGAVFRVCVCGGGSSFPDTYFYRRLHIKIEEK